MIIVQLIALALSFYLHSFLISRPIFFTLTFLSLLASFPAQFLHSLLLDALRMLISVLNLLERQLPYWSTFRISMLTIVVGRRNQSQLILVWLSQAFHSLDQWGHRWTTDKAAQVNWTHTRRKECSWWSMVHMFQCLPACKWSQSAKLKCNVVVLRSSMGRNTCQWCRWSGKYKTVEVRFSTIGL